MLYHKCVYAYLFETPPPENESNKRYPKAPHPFVFNIAPCPSEKIIEKGEEVTIDMTLMGKAIEYFPYIIYAISKMGVIGIGKGRGKFDLEKVSSLDMEGSSQKELYHEGDLKTAEPVFSIQEAFLQSKKLPADSLTLSFQTPFRLVERGSLNDSPEFTSIMKNLVLRLINIHRFHCGNNADLPVLKLLKAADDITICSNTTKWYDWERYSKRQDRRMRLGGIIGDVTYKGNLDIFLPFLVVGSWMHIGKATSFGLGRYVLKATTQENKNATS